MNVLELAAREAAAAAQKATAEGTYRRCWWSLTEGVAILPDAEWRSRADEVAAVAGCGRAWLSSRRALGKRIAEVDRELLAQVPPRLAVEYARGERVLDAAAARFLIGWEREDKGLRDLATELGQAGPSWANKAQRESAPATVEQVQAALADPAIARQVAAHAGARAAFQGATDSWAREATRSTHWEPLPPNVTQTQRVGTVTTKLLQVRTLLAEVRRELVDVGLDEAQTGGVLGAAEAIGHELELLRQTLRPANFEADLDELLRSQS